MVCSSCISACSVPICTDEIIIGTITSVNTDVKIIIENKTTGRKQYVSTQSDGAGLVTLVTAGMGLMADQTYEISVLLATAVALCDTEILTIGESTGKCVSFQFENIKDNYGCQITFASQTLTPNAPQTPGLPCICVTQPDIDNWNACCPESAPKVYRALLTQSGVDAPVVVSTNASNTPNTPFENTIGNIVWSYLALGQYLGTLAGAFPKDKMEIYFGNPYFDAAQYRFNIVWNNINSVIILTSVLITPNPNNPSTVIQASSIDDAIDFMPITIRINP